MPNGNYDLTSLENTITLMKDDPSVIHLNNFRTELNKYFTEANCVDVIYTKNIDKIFFGVYVDPILISDQINSILLSDEAERIVEYRLELDSKLYERDLTDQEIVALVLSAVGSMVIDSSPVITLRRIMDSYFIDNCTQLSLKNSVQYQQILAFGIQDSLMKITSPFYMNTGENANAILLYNNERYQDQLQSAIDKCNEIVAGMTKGVKNPNIVIMDWCFRLYNNIETGRICAVGLLNKVKSFSPSVLQRDEIDKVIRALNRIDNLSESGIHNNVSTIKFLTESLKKRGSIFSQLRYNGLRGIEDDFYEFMVRARNAETEDEVMYALKQINTRLSILDDYILTEELPEADRERWVALYYKYRDIRDEIAKKKVYNRKNYGLFFDYNQLDKIDQMD